MKKITVIIALALFALGVKAQLPGGFGFGGQQLSAEDMHYSQKFSDINYAGDNEAYHTLDIYLPEKKQDKYPVVIHIYGSAWFSNSSKGMADLGTICTALLKAGYAVVTPNHRSSMDAKYPAQIHDIKAVIRFLRAKADEYNLDTSFIATSGFSSGGHLSSLAGATSGTTTETIGTETIDLEGNVGLYSDYSSRVDEGMKMEVSPEEVLLGVKKEDNPDRYKTLSPISYLDADDVPIIVFHGTVDNVVPFCQGEIFARALQDKGVKHEFYPVEGGGHGFNMYNEENLSRMLTFLNKAREAQE